MLFDKEFEFVGKHAKYCRFLKEKGVFKTFREVYSISAIVGFVYGRTAAKDIVKNSAETVQPASILASEMQGKRKVLTETYRLIMLLHEVEGYSITDYQNRTFRDDADAEAYPDKLKDNMNLFNSYVLGGLELIYDKFKDCDDEKSIVNVMNDFLLEFYEDNDLMPE